MEDSYSFSYECRAESFGENGPEVDYTTIDVSALRTEPDVNRYEVDFYLHDTPTLDLQSIGYDMFQQVESQFLSDLSAYGIGRSMLTYP